MARLCNCVWILANKYLLYSKWLLKKTIFWGHLTGSSIKKIKEKKRRSTLGWSVPAGEIWADWREMAGRCNTQQMLNNTSCRFFLYIIDIQLRCRLLLLLAVCAGMMIPPNSLASRDGIADREWRMGRNVYTVKI